MSQFETYDLQQRHKYYPTDALYQDIHGQTIDGEYDE